MIGPVHSPAMRYAHMASMVRAVRRERGLRQIDLAALAQVSQQTVSRLEHGELDRLQFCTVNAVADALGMVLDLGARWKGARVDRLLDGAHSALVERIVKTVSRQGWHTAVELSFNRYGERGSVDLVGWHAGHAALLIVEVKSQVVDLQDLLATLDRKARIVPGEVARERGWRARRVGVVLVLPAASGPRDAVARHSATFGSAFPGRTREVRRWLLTPDANLRAVWFVRATPREGGTERATSTQRVRRT